MEAPDNDACNSVAKRRRKTGVAGYRSINSARPIPALISLNPAFSNEEAFNPGERALRRLRRKERDLRGLAATACC